MKKISFSDWWSIPLYNDPTQASPGQVEIDAEKCTGCGFCVKACPADALVLEEKKVSMQPAGINECMGCGYCMPIWPSGAITLVKGNEFTGYYKTIDRGGLEFPRLSY
jgi:NAD-dependent dihydropyrimidine dehydrogenase PreA subunit